MANTAIPRDDAGRLSLLRHPNATFLMPNICWAFSPLSKAPSLIY